MDWDMDWDGEDKVAAGCAVATILYILFWMLVIGGAIGVGCWWLVTHA